MLSASGGISICRTIRLPRLHLARAHRQATKSVPGKAIVAIAYGLMLVALVEMHGRKGTAPSFAHGVPTNTLTRASHRMSPVMLARFHEGGAIRQSLVQRNLRRISPTLSSAFPDLKLWFAGPADVRRSLCEAIHPGLKRAPLPIPFPGRTGAHIGDDQSSNKAAATPPDAVALPDTIPVIVLSHNNPTYLFAMIRFLRCYGVENITVYDTASSLPLHLEMLDALESVVTVRRLPTNKGPRSFVSAANFAGLPRFFALTDADLRPHPDLAPNFLAYLTALTQVFPGRRAGFALDLARKDQFLQGKYEGNVSISEWEEQFWARRLPVPGNAPPDALYDAIIDTTFAVYDRNAYVPDAEGKIEWRYDGVRVGGTFAATHVPWLCYAAARYLTAEEWTFIQSRKNKWSTSGRLAQANADRLGDVCMSDQAR